MDNTRLDSPERPPVRTTYLDRPKQPKRKREEHADESQESSDIEFTERSKKARTPSPFEVPFSGPITKSTLKKASVASGAKLVRDTSRRELDLPGPEPRRPPANVATTPSSTASKKKKAHAKSISLGSSTDGPLQTTSTPSKPASSSVSSKKPASSVASNRSIKPPSVSKRAGTPETEAMDDGTSIAESAVSLKGKRRVESERIQYYQDQPLCTEITPHEVKCKKCGRTVKLGKGTTYAVRPWEIHRARCDLAKPKGAAGNDSGSPAVGGFGLRMTMAERKAYLEEDPNCADVDPQQVTCKKCGKMIRLSTQTQYKLNNWLAHTSSCARPQIPSTRVETATRQVQLVNDPQAKSFDARHVSCKYCDARVELTGPGHYRLESWNEHKKTCMQPDRPPIEDQENGVPSSASTIPFPSSKPPSSATKTTERIMIAQQLLHPSPSENVDTEEQKGKKRAREDEIDNPQAADSQDARPSNRPRTSSREETSVEDSPGLLGWMMLPFHSFVRGFRESLSRG